MTTRETSAEIEEAAAAWLARLDRAPLGSGEEQALQAWLAGDMRRLGAFARGQAMMLRLEPARALGVTYDPDAFLGDAATEPPAAEEAPLRPTRRRLLQVGVGGMVAAMVGAGYLVSRPAAVDYASGGEKIRRVALADGSVIRLNIASAITVHFTPEARIVMLKAGEVLFDVVKDADRPFIVHVGQTSLRALETVFSVRRQMGEAVQVLVRKGMVELRRSGDAGPSLPLRANMLAQVDEDRSVPLRIDRVGGDDGAGDADNGLSWLEGKLTFRGTRLVDAADEFARYNGDRTILLDPSLGDHRISGAFAADDPDGFAQAVATSYGLRVERGGRIIRILP
jgi:transmembrane sensor